MVGFNNQNGCCVVMTVALLQQSIMVSMVALLQ